MLHTHIGKLTLWGFRCTPSDAVSPEPAHQGDPLQPDAAGLSILWVSHSNTPMVSPRSPGLPSRGQSVSLLPFCPAGSIQQNLGSLNSQSWPSV